MPTGRSVEDGPGEQRPNGSRGAQEFILNSTVNLNMCSVQLSVAAITGDPISTVKCDYSVFTRIVDFAVIGQLV